MTDEKTKAKSGPAKTKKKKRKTKTKRRRGQNTGWTTKKRLKFCETLAETGNVSEACRLIPVSKQAAYNERKRNEGFHEAWTMALEMAADALEAEARRRALDGIDVPLHHKGQLTGHVVKRYSDNLLMFLLKGNKPEKFKDRQQVESSAQVEHTVLYLPENNR